MGDSLVLFDVDNIKGHVFATGRLKEIRGGSAQVEELTKREAIEALIDKRNPLLRALGQARVIYADGGAGKVCFASAADAEHFCRDLEQEYRTATLVGSLTTACVPYTESIGPTVEQGEAALRRQKADRRDTLQFEGGPYVKFCESCGAHPVAYADTVRTGLPLLSLCQSCHRKRMRALALEKQSFIGNRTQFQTEFLKHIPSRYQQEWQADKIRLPDELDDLGAVSQPPNYLGFIYCDANGVGDHWGEIAQQLGATDEDYSRFSAAISTATLEAAAEALAQCFPRPRPTDNGKPIVPFEIVIMGGDDLVLLVAADKALDVATAYCQAFKQLTTKKMAGSRTVTASAGVVLAHASQPILFLEQRANELLRLAKQTPQSRYEGAVDFLVVSTATLNPISRIRREEGYEDQDHGLRRTLRPYPASQLRTLLDWACKLKFGITTGMPAEETGDEGQGDPEQRGFPRNKLNALYDAVFHSREQAAFATAQMLCHLGKWQKELLLRFLGDFGCTQPPPWTSTTSNDPPSTVLADLVEIYDFIQLPENEDGA